MNYQPPPPDSANESAPALRAFARQIASAVAVLFQGKFNNTGSVTLTAGATTTVLADPRLTVDSVLQFDPLTANAAAELAAGTLYVLAANRNNATATLTHANAVTTDRTFRYTIIG